MHPREQLSVDDSGGMAVQIWPATILRWIRQHLTFTDGTLRGTEAQCQQECACAVCKCVRHWQNICRVGL